MPDTTGQILTNWPIIPGVIIGIIFIHLITRRIEKRIMLKHIAPTHAIPHYHDLYVTTPKISRVSFTSLPYRCQIMCTRVGGWQLWAMADREYPEELLGSEYGCDWLVLDVAGHVICDGRPECARV